MSCRTAERLVPSSILPMFDSSLLNRGKIPRPAGGCTPWIASAKRLSATEAAAIDACPSFPAKWMPAAQDIFCVRI